MSFVFDFVFNLGLDLVFDCVLGLAFDLILDFRFIVLKILKIQNCKLCHVYLGLRLWASVLHDFVTNLDPTWVIVGSVGIHFWDDVGAIWGSQTQLVRPSGHETPPTLSPRQHFGPCWALLSRFRAVLGPHGGVPLRL